MMRLATIGKPPAGRSGNSEIRQPETAAATLRDVRHAMKIDYFDGNNLLK